MLTEAHHFPSLRLRDIVCHRGARCQRFICLARDELHAIRRWLPRVARGSRGRVCRVQLGGRHPDLDLHEADVSTPATRI